MRGREIEATRRQRIQADGKTCFNRARDARFSSENPA
jgi:hypothetical protein